MSNPCSGGGRETLIFNCAGAAHAGQVSNRAGMSLAQLGAGSAFCIAAVAAEIRMTTTNMPTISVRIRVALILLLPPVRQAC